MPRLRSGGRPIEELDAALETLAYDKMHTDTKTEDVMIIQTLLTEYQIPTIN